MNHRTLVSSPEQDARVLRFVPQIGLEHAQPIERRQMLQEQALFVRTIEGRGGGAAEIRKGPADPRPESGIGVLSGAVVAPARRRQPRTSSRTTTRVAPKSSASCASHDQPDRWRQQYRLNATKPISGNE